MATAGWRVPRSGHRVAETHEVAAGNRNGCCRSAGLRKVADRTGESRVRSGKSGALPQREYLEDSGAGRRTGAHHHFRCCRSASAVPERFGRGGSLPMPPAKQPLPINAAVCRAAFASSPETAGAFEARKVCIERTRCFSEKFAGIFGLSSEIPS
jgi:hypothetical protein